MRLLLLPASLALACASPPAAVPIEIPPVASSVATSAAVTSSSPISPPSAGPAADAADACAVAFDDQLTLYIDVEVREKGVHPGWKSLFLERCRRMPLPFQRCASPLYQVEHERECEAVKAESGTPAARLWSATFSVLQGAPPSLAGPP